KRADLRPRSRGRQSVLPRTNCYLVGFLDEIRSVLGQNPIAQGEPFQLAHDLGIRPVQPDLPAQRARLARGPQLGDVVVSRLRAAARVRRESLLSTVPPPRYGDGPRPLRPARPPEAAEHHQLVSGEQVGETLRLDVV